MDAAALAAKVLLLQTDLLRSHGVMTIEISQAPAPPTDMSCKPERAVHPDRKVAVLGDQYTAIRGDAMASCLYNGSRGSEVERLQVLLNNCLHLSPPLIIDGIFGPRTEAAVRQIQANEGTTVDGVVGTKTWAILEGGCDDYRDKLRWAMPPSSNAPWMAVAEREMGQSEWPDMLHNPRILHYFSATSMKASADEVHWCSAFVNWCLKEVGIAGTNSARAVDWLPWGKAAVPTAGAITIVRRVTGENHVAFLVSETASHYRLLGGNQRNKVKVSKYPKREYFLLGYRWPQ